MRQGLKNIGLVTLLSSLLTGCSFNPFTSHNQTTGSLTGTAVGAGIGTGAVALFGGSKPALILGGLTGAAIGYYVTTLRFASAGVMQAGGQVYQLGDRVGIDIPSDQLFEPNTADFLPQAPAILDSAAVILRRYPDNNIVISGNTSGFGRAKWERALSQKRAKEVAAYLWDQGINQFKDPGIHSRQLTYVGYGDYFPIATHLTNTGIRQNSHIQITSYPSKEDLGLGKRHAGMRNIGAMNDDDTLNGPDENPCGGGDIDKCFKD